MEQVKVANGGDDKAGVNNHPTSNKIAMSKALGQAFLSHQVRRMEEDAGGRGRHNNNRRGSSRVQYDTSNKSRNTVAKRGVVNTTSNDGNGQPVSKPPSRIVLDASVLIHALDQVRKWCSADSETKIIIPLEGESRQSPNVCPVTDNSAIYSVEHIGPTQKGKLAHLSLCAGCLAPLGGTSWREYACHRSGGCCSSRMAQADGG